MKIRARDFLPKDRGEARKKKNVLCAEWKHKALAKEDRSTVWLNKVSEEKQPRIEVCSIAQIINTITKISSDQEAGKHHKHNLHVLCWTSGALCSLGSQQFFHTCHLLMSSLPCYPGCIDPGHTVTINSGTSPCWLFLFFFLKLLMQISFKPF